MGCLLFSSSKPCKEGKGKGHKKKKEGKGHKKDVGCFLLIKGFTFLNYTKINP